MTRQGYELFLPEMVASFRNKLEEDKQLTDKEFKAMVAVVFRNTVLMFAKESKLMRRQIPIDVYKGVKAYDILPPEGYYIEAVVRLRTGASRLPASYTMNDSELILHNCCPDHSIDKAWYAEVAVVPLRTSPDSCFYDEEFLSKYYDVISAGMFWSLLKMPERGWSTVTMIRIAKKDYKDLLYSAIKGGTDTLKPMKLRYRRLSDGMCSR